MENSTITVPNNEITLSDVLSRLFIEKYTWTSDDLLAFSLKILAVLFVSTIILPLSLIRIVLAIIIFILFMLYIVVRGTNCNTENAKKTLGSKKNILKKPIKIEKFYKLKEKLNKNKKDLVNQTLIELKQSFEPKKNK